MGTAAVSDLGAHALLLLVSFTLESVLFPFQPQLLLLLVLRIRCGIMILAACYPDYPRLLSNLRCPVARTTHRSNR